MAEAGSGYCGCKYDSECGTTGFCWHGPGACDFEDQDNIGGGGHISNWDFSYPFTPGLDGANGTGGVCISRPRHGIMEVRYPDPYLYEDEPNRLKHQYCGTYDGGFYGSLDNNEMDTLATAIIEEIGDGMKGDIINQTRVCPGAPHDDWTHFAGKWPLHFTDWVDMRPRDHYYVNPTDYFEIALKVSNSIPALASWGEQGIMQNESYPGGKSYQMNTWKGPWHHCETANNSGCNYCDSDSGCVPDIAGHYNGHGPYGAGNYYVSNIPGPSTDFGGPLGRTMGTAGMQLYPRGCSEFFADAFGMTNDPPSGDSQRQAPGWFSATCIKTQRSVGTNVDVGCSKAFGFNVFTPYSADEWGWNTEFDDGHIYGYGDYYSATDLADGGFPIGWFGGGEDELANPFRGDDVSLFSYNRSVNEYEYTAGGFSWKVPGWDMTKAYGIYRPYRLPWDPDDLTDWDWGDNNIYCSDTAIAANLPGCGTGKYEHRFDMNFSHQGKRQAYMTDRAYWIIFPVFLPYLLADYGVGDELHDSESSLWRNGSIQKKMCFFMQGDGGGPGFKANAQAGAWGHDSIGPSFFEISVGKPWWHEKYCCADGNDMCEDNAWYNGFADPWCSNPAITEEGTCLNFGYEWMDPFGDCRDEAGDEICDSNCVPIISGCTDSGDENYNPDANWHNSNDCSGTIDEMEDQDDDFQDEEDFYLYDLCCPDTDSFNYDPMCMEHMGAPGNGQPTYDDLVANYCIQNDPPLFNTPVQEVILAEETTADISFDAYDGDSFISAWLYPPWNCTMSEINGRQIGDINNDGLVNELDLALLIGHLNGTGTTLTGCDLAVADLTMDGIVNTVDIQMIVNHMHGMQLPYDFLYQVGPSSGTPEDQGYIVEVEPDPGTYSDTGGNGTFLYTPPTHYFGQDEIQVYAFDGLNYSENSGLVNFHVWPVNDVPIMDSPPSQNVYEGNKLTSGENTTNAITITADDSLDALSIPENSYSHFFGPWDYNPNAPLYFYYDKLIPYGWMFVNQTGFDSVEELSHDAGVPNQQYVLEDENGNRQGALIKFNLGDTPKTILGIKFYQAYVTSPQYQIDIYDSSFTTLDTSTPISTHNVNNRSLGSAVGVDGGEQFLTGWNTIDITPRGQSNSQNEYVNTSQSGLTGEIYIHFKNLLGPTADLWTSNIVQGNSWLVESDDNITQLNGDWLIRLFTLPFDKIGQLVEMNTPYEGSELEGSELGAFWGKTTYFYHDGTEVFYDSPTMDITLNTHVCDSDAQDQELEVLEVGMNNEPITQTVNPGIGLCSNTEQLSITYRNSNDAPTLNPQNFYMLEDCGVPGTAGTCPQINFSNTSYDPDSQNLFYIITQLPENGTLWEFTSDGTIEVTNTPYIVDGNDLRYSPNPNWWGVDSFQAKVSDSGNGDPSSPNLESSDTIFKMVVESVNDAPVAYDGTTATLEDTDVTVTLSAMDIDYNSGQYIDTESSLQYWIESLPDYGYLRDNTTDIIITSNLLPYLVNPSSPTLYPFNNTDLTYVPPLNWNGETSFEFYTVDVVPTTGTYDVALDYEVPPDGIIDSPTTQPNNTGQDTALYQPGLTATSNSATQTLVISAVDDPPVLFYSVHTGLEDTPFEIKVTGLDVDSDVSFIYDSLGTYPSGFCNSADNPVWNGEPQHGFMDLVSGDNCLEPGCNPNYVTWTYTPDSNWHGTDSITVCMLSSKDGVFQTETGPITMPIHVFNVDDAPVANNLAGLITNEDTTKDITINAWDIDSSLEFIIVDQPQNGTLGNFHTQQLTYPQSTHIDYTPNLNYWGPDEFTYYVRSTDLTNLVALDLRQYLGYYTWMVYEGDILNLGYEPNTELTGNDTKELIDAIVQVSSQTYFHGMMCAAAQLAGTECPESEGMASGLAWRPTNYGGYSVSELTNPYQILLQSFMNSLEDLMGEWDTSNHGVIGAYPVCTDEEGGPTLLSNYFGFNDISGEDGSNVIDAECRLISDVTGDGLSDYGCYCHCSDNSDIFAGTGALQCSDDDDTPCWEYCGVTCPPQSVSQLDEARILSGNDSTIFQDMVRTIMVESYNSGFSFGTDGINTNGILNSDAGYLPNQYVIGNNIDTPRPNTTINQRKFQVMLDKIEVGLGVYGSDSPGEIPLNGICNTVKQSPTKTVSLYVIPVNDPPEWKGGNDGNGTYTPIFDESSWTSSTCTTIEGSDDGSTWNSNVDLQCGGNIEHTSDWDWYRVKCVHNIAGTQFYDIKTPSNGALYLTANEACQQLGNVNEIHTETLSVYDLDDDELSFTWESGCESIIYSIDFSNFSGNSANTATVDMNVITYPYVYGQCLLNISTTDEVQGDIGEIGTPYTIDNQIVFTINPVNQAPVWIDAVNEYKHSFRQGGLMFTNGQPIITGYDDSYIIHAKDYDPGTTFTWTCEGSEHIDCSIQDQIQTSTTEQFLSTVPVQWSSARIYMITDPADFAGEEIITISVSDGEETVSKEIPVNVLPANTAPVITTELGTYGDCSETFVIDTIQGITSPDWTCQFDFYDLDRDYDRKWPNGENMTPQVKYIYDNKINSFNVNEGFSDGSKNYLWYNWITKRRESIVNEITFSEPEQTEEFFNETSRQFHINLNLGKYSDDAPIIEGTFTSGGFIKKLFDDHGVYPDEYKKLNFKIEVADNGNEYNLGESGSLNDPLFNAECGYPFGDTKESCFCDCVNGATAPELSLSWYSDFGHFGQMYTYNDSPTIWALDSDCVPKDWGNYCPDRFATNYGNDYDPWYKTGDGNANVGLLSMPTDWNFNEDIAGDAEYQEGGGFQGVERGGEFYNFTEGYMGYLHPHSSIDIVNGASSKCEYLGMWRTEYFYAGDDTVAGGAVYAPIQPWNLYHEYNGSLNTYQTGSYSYTPTWKYRWGHVIEDYTGQLAVENNGCRNCHGLEPVEMINSTDGLYDYFQGQDYNQKIHVRSWGKKYFPEPGAYFFETFRDDAMQIWMSHGPSLAKPDKIRHYNFNDWDYDKNWYKEWDKGGDGIYSEQGTWWSGGLTMVYSMWDMASNGDWYGTLSNYSSPGLVPGANAYPDWISPGSMGNTDHPYYTGSPTDNSDMTTGGIMIPEAGWYDILVECYDRSQHYLGCALVFNGNDANPFGTPYEQVNPPDQQFLRDNGLRLEPADEAPDCQQTCRDFCHSWYLKDEKNLQLTVHSQQFPDGNIEVTRIGNYAFLSSPEYVISVHGEDFDEMVRGVENPNFGGWYPFADEYILKINQCSLDFIIPDTPVNQPQCGNNLLDSSFLGYNVSELINGYSYRFQESGIYEIAIESNRRVFNHDSAWVEYGDTYATQTKVVYIDVTTVVELEQSLGGTMGTSYLPWQAINIPSEELELQKQNNTQLIGDVPVDISNRLEIDKTAYRNWLDETNLDSRPMLGCFYYAEDNPIELEWGDVVGTDYDSFDKNIKNTYFEAYHLKEEPYEFSSYPALINNANLGQLKDDTLYRFSIWVKADQETTNNTVRVQISSGYPNYRYSAVTVDLSLCETTRYTLNDDPQAAAFDWNIWLPYDDNILYPDYWTHPANPQMTYPMGNVYGVGGDWCRTEIYFLTDYELDVKREDYVGGGESFDSQFLIPGTGVCEGTIPCHAYDWGGPFWNWWGSQDLDWDLNTARNECNRTGACQFRMFSMNCEEDAGVGMPCSQYVGCPSGGALDNYCTYIPPEYEETETEFEEVSPYQVSIYVGSPTNMIQCGADIDCATWASPTGLSVYDIYRPDLYHKDGVPYIPDGDHPRCSCPEPAETTYTLQVSESDWHVATITYDNREAGGSYIGPGCMLNYIPGNTFFSPYIEAWSGGSWSQGQVYIPYQADANGCCSMFHQFGIYGETGWGEGNYSNYATDWNDLFDIPWIQSPLVPTAVPGFSMGQPLNTRWIDGGIVTEDQTGQGEGDVWPRTSFGGKVTNLTPYACNDIYIMDIATEGCSKNESSVPYKCVSPNTPENGESAWYLKTGEIFPKGVYIHGPRLQEVGEVDDQEITLSDDLTIGEGSDIVCAEVMEHNEGALACPNPDQVITDILFDSYGTPSGTCLLEDNDIGYEYDFDCHAPCLDSFGWIGQKEAVVYANNDTCGDPCYGTYKHRYVAVRCKSPSSIWKTSGISLPSNNPTGVTEVSEILSVTRVNQSRTGVAMKFIPDADVRPVQSITGHKSVLTKYYDLELQPELYMETVAPVEAQFYFYPRRTEGESIFDKKPIVDLDGTNFYIGFIEWGDGTDEFNREPFELKPGRIVRHTYDRFGVYEVTGYMFSFIPGKGTDDYQKFRIRINVNKDPNLDRDFSLIGRDKFVYLPYEEKTLPVVSGVTDHSIYKKTIRRQLGYISGSDEPIDINFRYYRDRFHTELALAKMDDEKIGKLISNFTGSVSSGSVETTGEFTNEEDTTLIYKGLNTNFGELGDYLGNCDIAQVRYFNEPHPITKMLGFKTPTDDYFSGLGEQLLLNNSGEEGVSYTVPYTNFNINHPNAWNPDKWTPGWNGGVCNDEAGHHAFWTHTDDLWDRHGIRCSNLDTNVFIEGEDVPISNYCVEMNSGNCNTPADVVDLGSDGVDDCENTSNNCARWMGVSERIVSNKNDHMDKPSSFEEVGISVGTQITVYFDQLTLGDVNKKVSRVGLHHRRKSDCKKVFDGAQAGFHNSVAGQWERFSFTFTVDDTWLLDGDTCDDPDVSFPDSESSYLAIYLYGHYRQWNGGGNFSGTNSDGEIIFFDNPNVRKVLNIDGINYDTPESAFNAWTKEHPGNPSSPRWWKNIIPETMNWQLDREGISQNLLDNDFTSEGWELKSKDNIDTEIFLNQEDPDKGFNATRIRFGSYVDGSSIDNQLLRYDFRDNYKNKIMPYIKENKDYLISGWIKANKYGIKDNGEDCTDILRVDIGDITSEPGNPIFMGIDENEAPIGKWVYFKKQIPISGNLPNIGSNGIPYWWLDISPGHQTCNDSDLEFYNLMLEEIPEYSIDFLNSDREYVPVGGGGTYFDIFSSQEWLGENEYGNIYYYPVLPKYDYYGQWTDWLTSFPLDGSSLEIDDNDEQVVVMDMNSYIPKIPFGSPERIWNQDDNESWSTNNFINEGSLLMDVSFESIEENLLGDNSGNSIIGISIFDFSVEFDEITKSPKGRVNTIKTKIGRKNDKKAY